MALLTITVLMTMVTASSYMLNNEIKINTYNIDRVQALYTAEAGIEKVINEINFTITEDELKGKLSDFNIANSTCEYLEIVKDENEFKIIVKGKAENNAKRKIKATIALVNVYSEKPFIYGTDFIINENSESNGNNGEDNSNLSNSGQQVNELDAIDDDVYDDYINDKNVIEKADGYNGDLDLNSGEVVYIKGKGTLNDIEVSYSEGDNLPVVVVDDDLTLDNIHEVNNIVLMIKGNFKYKTTGKGTLKNTYIYSEGNVTFKGHAKEESPGNSDEINGPFTFKGQCVAESNVKFKISTNKKNQTINYLSPRENGVPSDISGIKITSWQEVN